MHRLSGDRERRGGAASVDIVCQPVKSFQVTNVFAAGAATGAAKTTP